MDIEEIRNYCLIKKGVTESFPFDDETLVMKVMNKNKPTISVVLPIRNEEKNICQTLKGLFSQD